MRCTLADPKLLCSLSYGCIVIYYVIGNINNPFFNISFKNKNPCISVCTVYAGNGKIFCLIVFDYVIDVKLKIFAAKCLLITLLVDN